MAYSGARLEEWQTRASSSDGTMWPVPAAPAHNWLVYRYQCISKAYFQRGPAPSRDRLRSVCWLIIQVDRPLSDTPQRGRVKFVHTGIFDEIGYQVCADWQGEALIVDGPMVAECEFSYLGKDYSPRKLIFSELSFGPTGTPESTLVGHHFGQVCVKRFVVGCFNDFQ